MNICLKTMTKELCRKFRQELEQDPMLFMDMSKFQPFVYNEAESDAYFERYAKLGRTHMAIMMDEEPIGELVLKNFDDAMKSCELGICMKNDTFKNKGYGTCAEILALEYAFYTLGMETVYADSILKNKRSQHVLQKVGFVQTHCDDTFIYYRADKRIWQRPDL